MSLPPWEDPIEQQFGSFEDGWDVTRTLDYYTVPLINGFTALDHVVFLTAEDGPEQDIPGTITIVDGVTGELVGQPIEGHDEWWFPAVSGDGRYIAFPLVYYESGSSSVSGALQPQTEGGRVLVVDGETGEELFRVDRDVGVRVVTFDDNTGELIAAFYDGSIVTVDLETQEVVAETNSGVTAPVFEMGVRPDGRVALLTSGSAELIDRRFGALGISIGAPEGAVYGRFLPDGHLAVWTDKPSVEIYDFDASNALIERSWDVDDPLGEYAFNDGRAGAVDNATGGVRVVDLATGGESLVTLRARDGTPFNPIKAYPESDGVAAIQTDGLYGRFVDGDMVESLQIDGLSRGGTRFGDVWSLIVERPDGTFGVDVIDLTAGATRVLQSIPADGVPSVVHPTLDGGVHFAVPGGPLQMFNPSGALVGEFEVPGRLNNIVALDSSERWIAAGIATGGLVVIDTSTGEVELPQAFGEVLNLGFGSDGELLAVTFADGRVRLWDVVRGEWAGLIWDGDGAVASSPSWYDTESETMWLFASGKLIQVPLNAERWIEKACALVGDGFTQDEWDRYVPGDEPLTSACN